MIKSVCVVLVDRANYGRMEPVMHQIKQDLDLKLQIVCAGTMLLERFGHAALEVEKAGFRIDSRVYLEVEGSTPATMAKSVGLGIIEFTSAFQNLNPDLVLMIGDRYEAMAAVLAASYMNIKVAHIQGGEVSGSIDESTRHAITKFAHLHFPATSRSAKFIVDMGEDPKYVHRVGCPVGDTITSIQPTLESNVFLNNSVGSSVYANEPYLLVLFHPVTTEFASKRSEVLELLTALSELNVPTVWLWPNIDAGSDGISKELRRYREIHKPDWLCFVKNFDPTTYQKVLINASCAVGNSSSFVRDSTFSGTPVVLVGDRQQGREIGGNTIKCKAKSGDILKSVKFQLKHGRYPAENLYGDGNASKRIVDHIKRFDRKNQKMLSYCTVES